MASFKGYLLKAVKTGKIFNSGWIEIESYSSTPNQREEISAKRDDYTRNLIRVTAPGKKTAIEFTVSSCDLKTKMEIQDFFYAGETDHLQRKIELEYWNDEDNKYETGFFYRPDIKFTISEHGKTDIKYKPLDISLVEY